MLTADSSQDRFRTVFENSPLGQKIIGPDLVIRQANRAVVAMLGLTHPRELVGRRILEFAHPDYRADWQDLHERLWEHKMPQHSLETCLVRADGSALWCRVSSILFPDEGGELGYTILEDITARRELAETTQRLDALEASVVARTQALHQSQAETEATAQKLLRVTESLPSTSFTTDATGQVRYISPQWYAYTGMVPGTDINETWPQLIHPDDLPAIAREFGAALAEGRPWGYEFRLRGADGHYRWFASQGVPEPLAEAAAAGRPRQWFGSNLDIDELKQAQRQLEEKDQLLTSILTSIPASVATFKGEDLRFGFFNDSFQRAGQGRAVLGRPASEVFPEAEAQGFLPLLREVLRTGEPYHAHETPAYVLAPATGERQEVFLDLAYLPLSHGDVPPHAVLSFSYDVTERVRARQRAEALQAELLAAAEQLAAEREAFYQVFEQTPACVALMRGPDHRFEYVNPAYQQLFPGRQLVGRPVAEVIPETVEQGFLVLLDGVYRTGATYFGQEMLWAVAQPAGHPPRDTYFDFTYQAMREAGHLVGISIFATDTTERVLARRQREAQQVQLHNLFMQAPIPVVIFDGPALTYQLVNPAYQHAFPGRELLGLPLLEALPELAGTPLLAQLAHVYQTGETYLAQELPMQFARHRGGPLEERYFTFTYQARRNEHGAVDGALLFGLEVTDQVVARQQVADANEQLTAANARLTRTNVDLDTFIYTASHDLKQPIANIEGLLTILREELPAPAAGQPMGFVPNLLDRMQRAVERFQLTIAQLTDVSRLQQAQAQPPEAVGLAALVEDVRQDLAPALAAAGTRLMVAVPAGLTLVFAPKNLRSIVYNLLSNAVKYHDPARPPVVELRAFATPTATVLEVQDNGLGLSPAQQARLYGMFQRLHDHVEGAGIGLFMVKRIVENAGGTIAVQSATGVGTTFTITLPHPAG